jgi:hypothetical protein
MDDKHIKNPKDSVSRQIQARDEIVDVMVARYGKRGVPPPGYPGYGYVSTWSPKGKPVDDLTLLAIAQKYAVAIEVDTAGANESRYRYCVFATADKPVGLSYVIRR